jgi:hypothetical protein
LGRNLRSLYSKVVYDRPKPKGKRGWIFRIIIAVSDKDAFTIMDFTFSRIIDKSRVVFQAARERDRQFAGGVDIAE